MYHRSFLPSRLTPLPFHSPSESPFFNFPNYIWRLIRGFFGFFTHLTRCYGPRKTPVNSFSIFENYKFILLLNSSNVHVRFTTSIHYYYQSNIRTRYSFRFIDTILAFSKSVITCISSGQSCIYFANLSCSRVQIYESVHIDHRNWTYASLSRLAMVSTTM